MARTSTARVKWHRGLDTKQCIARISGSNERQCEYEATTEVERYGVKIPLCVTHDRDFHSNQIGKRYGTA